MKNRGGPQAGYTLCFHAHLPYVMLQQSVTSTLADRPHLLGGMPIRPHLLRFIQFRENLHGRDPLTVPGMSPLSVALGWQICKKKAYYADPVDALYRTHTAVLRFQVSPSMYSDNLRFVSASGVRRYEEFVSRCLTDHMLFLFTQAKAQRRPGKDVIEEFLLQSGLDDFIDFDAAKKAVFRLRVHRKLPPLRGHLQVRWRPEQLSFAFAV